MTNEIRIRALSGAVGAEIEGADLSGPVSDALQKTLLDAFHRHGVLCIRDQELTRKRQIEIARLFGTPDVHPIARGMEEYPEMIRVFKPRGERAFFGTSWHSDNSFFERPSAITLLYAEQVPPVGGDTLYASMESAWALLSEPMKRFLKPLRAVHSARTAYDPRTTGDAKFRGETAIQYTFSDAIYEEVDHPVVRTHPVTGRKSLYVNPMFTQRILGLSPPESEGILRTLHEISTRPELTCRIRWENGTLAIWDNRWLQHHAIDDYADYDRIMYRVTLEGERPV
ncbi:MAG: TauD/TfdA dioxygenase family protein [bacterium]